jgi:hypothetical protein
VDDDDGGGTDEVVEGTVVVVEVGVSGAAASIPGVVVAQPATRATKARTANGRMPET